MGQQNAKRQEAGDEIISKKSLQAVKEITTFLKQHAREEGLFRRGGRRDVRRQILSSLRKGEKPQFENVENAALECAAALQIFICRLKKPVVPRHIQQLILADNPGVAAHVVARDALGLIRQDVGGRHGELLTDLLDLLKHLTFAGPPSERSELQGSPLPIALLPVFFTLTPADLVKWRQVAARFSELITEAPEQLCTNENRSNLESFSSAANIADTTIPAGTENSHPAIRLQDLPLFYPLFRLTDNRDACEIGEMTRILATPLRRSPANRLHPVISNPIR